jgi:hypothetical protein
LQAWHLRWQPLLEVTWHESKKVSFPLLLCLFSCNHIISMDKWNYIIIN